MRVFIPPPSLELLNSLMIYKKEDGFFTRIDLNRANNRWDNLRRATQSQNLANAPCHKNNKCGFKGVHRFLANGKRSNRWRAQIKKDGKVIHLGLFDTPEEAHARYTEAAKELHGEFARF